MKHEISPESTTRSKAFNLWMSSPMPMVTLTKTFDVSRVLKISKKKGMSFNMLLCWYIGKSAANVKEFYVGICSCDIPYTGELSQFSRDYKHMTDSASASGESIFLEDAMVIGTSAMIETELDSIINQYTDKFCNPMVIWGKYRRSFFKTTLPISFQFHHVQMDGGHAAIFLENLQKEMNSL